MKTKSQDFLTGFCRFLLALVFTVLTSSPSFAVNVTFGWDPNDEPDLEGYKVYSNIGDPGPPYKHRTTLPESKLDDPLNPMVTLTGLKEDTDYYVAVTAYNTDGNESRYSDDVCVQVVDSAIELCGSSSGGSSSSSSGESDSSGGGGGGGSGVFCFISSAGQENTYPMTGSFSLSRPAGILFSFLFLLFLVCSSFILIKIKKLYKNK
jgi:hypothetical protein